MAQNKFLENINDWNNHAYLLYLALQETKTGTVLELGCGDGSTQRLHDYCKTRRRMLHSFDWDENWINKYKHMETARHLFHYVDKKWELAKEICPDPTVVLVDHSPGERRVVDIRSFCDINGILVIHDTQPQPTAASYGFEMIWSYFKYKVDLTCPMNHEVNPPHNRTWASAVSNHYDVTKWSGKTFGEYTLR